MKYRIKRHQKVDRYCNVTSEWFTVEFLCKGWLGRTTWRTLQQSGYDGPIDQHFDTIEHAREIAERVKKGDPHDTVITTIAEIEGWENL